jgi:hypothetical protein
VTGQNKNNNKKFSVVIAGIFKRYTHKLDIKKNPRLDKQHFNVTLTSIIILMAAATAWFTVLSFKQFLLNFF